MNLDCYGNFTSQHGEDAIIQRIFETLSPSNKWCVEFGALDGVQWSNTWSLIKNRNWKSVQIESLKKYFKLLELTYKNDFVTCLNKTVGLDKENLLDTILAETSIPIDFDLLSIDIDGLDYQVFDSIKIYKPRVVVIECSPFYKHGELHIQSIPKIKFEGSSLASVTSLAKKKGYQLIFVTGVNAFYVKDELYSKFGILDNSISNFKIWSTTRKFKWR